MDWKVAYKISKFYSSALYIEERYQVKLQYFLPIANIMKNAVWWGKFTNDRQFFLEDNATQNARFLICFFKLL